MTATSISKAILTSIMMFFLASCHMHHCKNDWAKQDLKFIYQKIVDNHPGIYNTHDKHFKENLDKWYKLYSSKLYYSSTDTEKMAILTDFANEFNDGHMGIYWNDKNEEHKIIKDKLEFKVENFKPDITWIALPTFDPNKEQQKQLQKIVKALPKYRSKQIIVFDVRGNTGGNSHFSYQVTSSLFGKKYADNQIAKRNKNIHVDWRVSADNIQHLQDTYDKSAKNDSSHIKWLKKVIAGMQESHKHSQIYYTEKLEENRRIFKLKDQVKAKIILLVDGKCASACLDFVDDIMYMDHTAYIAGQVTSADRAYMDINSVKLPSNKGSFYFPMKVYHNRLRHDNQPYLPDIYFPNVEDTVCIRNHISENSKNY